MQPNDNRNVPPGELPHPQHDFVPTPQEDVKEAFEHAQGKAIESAIAAPGHIVPTDITASLPQVMGLPQAQTNLPAVAASTASPHSPQMADDGDLIEKEWVMKAKVIVNQTKNDPYLQTKEMNKMKADYLQKRYAKELKLPED